MQKSTWRCTFSNSQGYAGVNSGRIEPRFATGVLSSQEMRVAVASRVGDPSGEIAGGAARHASKSNDKPTININHRGMDIVQTIAEKWHFANL
jgi:hypothetical protein